MKPILTFLFSLFIAVFAAANVSMATGFDFTGTAVTFVATSVVLSFVPMPSGVFDVVLKSAFESELIRAIKTVKNDFLARVKDMTKHVAVDVIDMTKVGAKPNVLIDNAIYPITAASRTDIGVKLSLRKLTTEVTTVHEDEVYALPYDKKSSIIQDHKEAIKESYYKLSLHGFAPSASSGTTPVIETTGSDDGTGRLRLTKADLIRLRSAMNDLGIGICDLVLCNKHIEDILLWDETFAKQYQVISSGLVVPMYGFYISQNIGYNPVFDGVAKTKKAYGAASAGDDLNASVVFLGSRAIKAFGSVKMFYDEPTARNHQAEVNFDAHFIATPIDNEGFGAII